MKKLLVEWRRNDPKEAEKIARQRTQKLVQFYGQNIDTVGIQALASSCWLQGAEDVFQTLSKEEVQPVQLVDAPVRRFRPM